MKYAFHKRGGGRQQLEVVLLVIGLLGVLMAVYIGYSVSAWGNFDTKTTQRFEAIRTEARQAMASPMTTTDKSKQQVALEKLYTTMQQSKDECSLGILLQWQTLLPVNQDRARRCQQVLDKQRAFRDALGAVVAHLKAEGQTADIFAAAAKAKADASETDWPVVRRQWADATDTLHKMVAPSSFERTKKLAEAKVQAIEDAWGQVIDGNQAKNRSKYEQGVAALAQAYGTLDQLGQAAETDLVPLASRLSQTYTTAFN